MTRTRRWIPLWAGLVLMAASAVQWWLWFRSPSMRPGAGPFTVLTYLSLVALCNRSRMTVRPDGVEIRRGPLPTGAGNEWIPRDQIVGGYWRWKVHAPGSGNVSHWEAGIVHRDGRWLRHPDQFETEAQATQETAAVLTILGLREMRRVAGLPPKADWRPDFAVVLWMLVALIALGSAVVLEYRR